MSGDGARFLMVFSAWRREPVELNVVLHWFTDLRRLAPAERASLPFRPWPLARAR